MSPVFCCGFECGVNNTNHISLGTQSVFEVGVVRNGLRSLYVNQAGTSRTNFAGTSSVAVARVYVYFFNALPTVNQSVLAFQGPGGVYGGIAYKVADGKLYTALGNTTFGTTGVTAVVNQWIRLDIRVNAVANPWLIDGQVDGLALSQLSAVATAGTCNDLYFAPFVGSGVHQTIFDDVIISYTSADYPFGAGYVNHFVPTSDGTHTATGTVTVKGTIAAPTTGGAITSATTDAFNWVNAVPLLGGATDNTRLINAQTASATTYVEVKYGPAPGVSTPTIPPRAVEVINADRQAATTAGDFQIGLNDNGSVAAIVNRGTVAGSLADRYSTNQYAIPPSGGTWNLNASGNGSFPNLRARFGNSTDATPDQYWRGTMIEAEFPQSSAPITNNGNFLQFF